MRDDIAEQIREVERGVSRGNAAITRAEHGASPGVAAEFVVGAQQRQQLGRDETLKRVVRRELAVPVG